MSRTEKFVLWTERFSDEQCSIAVLVGYVSVLVAMAGCAWLVLR